MPDPLLTLSPLTLLHLWSELEQAYHGTNGYGGHVAELYAYRFMPYSPTAHNESMKDTSLGETSRAEVARDAAHCLYALLKLFARERDCKIDVDGRRLGTWLSKIAYDHRVHVTIYPREE